MKSRSRQMKYSLRTLCLAILVVSIVCAFYAFQSRAIRQHYEAIRQIEIMGGTSVLMTRSETYLNPRSRQSDPSGINNQILGRTKESFLNIMFGRPSLVLAQVDLKDPDLNEDDLRSMVPHLRKVILLPISEKYDGPRMYANGNGGFTPDLVKTIRSQLPRFNFSGPEHLPNSKQHPVRTGMTTTQVEQVVAQEMYDQRTDWVGDPAPILESLGSIHKTYPNADGTVTWTYAADDIGVRMLVIDFDDDRRVAKTSFSRGVPDRLRGKEKKLQGPTGIRLGAD